MPGIDLVSHKICCEFETKIVFLLCKTYERIVSVNRYKAAIYRQYNVVGTPGVGVNTRPFLRGKGIV